ncbi:gluconokinase [Paenibacillus physcomitrellae]|uniref:Gluconate kinase n=1 Tax=Paenibacillus physcomitrellae TaxID=1619311 RepID=A0ABQ1GP97_9BACL|nr:gluconokinase [Paenibacillus physcomitrellae]GGA47381.1 gluconate kinase [Paenibacillus physcomitrellae]
MNSTSLSPKQDSFYMIGVDIGTTSTKSVLFQQDGSILSTAHVEYPLYTPSADIAEQDPEEILSAVIETIRRVMTESVAAPEQVMFVSFSSAMHSVIPVDASGRPLMRGMTWADNRSAGWTDKLKRELGGHEIFLRTGTPIHPMSPLTKILWMRHEQPEMFAQTAKFISIKEYIFLKLFGEYVIDYSMASCTGLFELEKLDWDRGALETAGITPDLLSKPVPTTHEMKGLSPAYAEQMGLLPDTSFIVGATDGVLSNLGVNAIDPGVVAVTIGTSGAIRTVVDRPVIDPKGRIFCYALTDKLWVIGGPVNNGGVIFRWARDEFAASEVETAKRLGISPYDVLTKIAERVRPGSEGLLFHPYLAGERAPLWNPDARGSFFGLTLHHQKEHMIRAVLEGVIYNLYTVLLAMEEQIGQPSKIMATGGFARSELWRQMMADIFDQPVTVPESIESSCLGAVVLGLYAIGRADSLRVVADMVGSTHEHVPQKENAVLYKELLPIFIRLSRKLEDEYADLADFQRKHGSL